ncbi:putative Tigger transposable element-derived protein 1-like 235 [Homarus americanus]|uniref:Putative Tigger transposable element-derived protein 1-like 235 n=1 Tax=Homarus americanus TaxID=6706 RepID=A0A8J5MKV8_HOMAM|nr:putative Tigger transposable element-derived protein 1-like 235 [Homarus americanus]
MWKTLGHVRHSGEDTRPFVNRDILSLARQAGFDELESEDIEDVLASHTEELTNEDLQLLTALSPVEDEDNEPQQMLTTKRMAESLNMIQQAIQMLLDDPPKQRTPHHLTSPLPGSSATSLSPPHQPPTLTASHSHPTLLTARCQPPTSHCQGQPPHCQGRQPPPPHCVLHAGSGHNPHAQHPPPYSISAQSLATFVAASGVADPAISLILSALLTIECTIEEPSRPRPITDRSSYVTPWLHLNLWSNAPPSSTYWTSLDGVVISGGIIFHRASANADFVTGLEVILFSKSADETLLESNHTGRCGLQASRQYLFYDKHEDSSTDKKMPTDSPGNCLTTEDMWHSTTGIEFLTTPEAQALTLCDQYIQAVTPSNSDCNLTPPPPAAVAPSNSDCTTSPHHLLQQ